MVLNCLLVLPAMPFLRTISNAVLNAYILSWDVLLTLLNTVTPSRPVGHVIPEGHPGYGGQWPEYIAPTEGDSRCSCPALNAMANHGESLMCSDYGDFVNFGQKEFSLGMARISASPP